jgi:hypothetical protein
MPWWEYLDGPNAFESARFLVDYLSPLSGTWLNRKNNAKSYNTSVL